eukprot:2956300-Prymnesium_polylepis.1
MGDECAHCLCTKKSVPRTATWKCGESNERFCVKNTASTSQRLNFSSSCNNNAQQLNRVIPECAHGF